MGVLGNFQHERFAQDLHARIWRGEKRKDARIEAYKAAGFDGEQKFIADNARKLANRVEVKARVAELADYSSKLAGLDASWALLVLKRRVELVDQFNLDDYLSPPDANGVRRFDIGKVTPEVMARLAELSQDEEHRMEGEGDNAEPVTIRKIRIKGYQDITGPLALMAKIAGWAAPDKIEHSGSLTLEALVLASYAPPTQPKPAPVPALTAA